MAGLAPGWSPEGAVSMGIWKRLSRPRFLFVYPLIPLLFVLGRTTETHLRAGIIVLILGETLRLWANGFVGHRKVNWTQKWRSDPKIGSLITAGPYAYVRHPLYLGTFLLGAGFCIIVGNFWLSLLALAFFLIVYRRKMAREEALLHGELGTPYLAYHAAVPQWLPTGTRYANRQGQWSWQGVLASKEWKTVVWVIALTISLYFWEELVQEHERFFDGHGYRAFLFGVLVALLAADGLAELFTRRGKALRASDSAGVGFAFHRFLAGQQRVEYSGKHGRTPARNERRARDGETGNQESECP